MTNSQKISIFLLRFSMGIMFFWAGITKVLDPSWSAVGYLKGAKMLTGFYAWLIGPNVLPIVNFLNEWGLTLLGISLIIGVGVRISSVLGIILMILYYIPLGFPYPNEHAFIVDEHIIYAASLLVLFYFNAGSVWSLKNYFKRNSS